MREPIAALILLKTDENEGMRILSRGARPCEPQAIATRSHHRPLALIELVSAGIVDIELGAIITHCIISYIMYRYGVSVDNH
jgi:hypothetical protein